MAVAAVVMGCVASGDVRDGYQVLRSPDGTVEEGPVANSKRIGHWVHRHPDGRVGEGSFVDGRLLN